MTDPRGHMGTHPDQRLSRWSFLCERRLSVPNARRSLCNRLKRSETILR
jgi:hypothetical protein